MNGYFIISLDFEKHWGVRDHSTVKDYWENLVMVDEACDEILKLFKKYKIEATWATVGFLMFDSKKELLNNIPSTIPTYKENSLNPYESLKNENLERKYHFSPGFINKIINEPSQEFASHTFSHYYCNEPGQTIQNFEDDLKIFNDSVTYKLGKDNLPTSIVFPRNQVNKKYLNLFSKYGINAYRGNERSWLFKRKMNITFKRAIKLLDSYLNITGPNTYKKEDLLLENKLIDIPSSRFLRPYNKLISIFDFLKLRRVKNQMTFAAKNNELFHLWFHPHNFGKDMEANLEFLEKILKHYSYLKNEFNYQSLNMRNYHDKYR